MKSEELPKQWHGITWKIVVTTLVLGFGSGVASHVGDIAAGKFETWMLLPMLGFGLCASTGFLFAQFLWRLHKSDRDLTTTVAALEKKLTGKKERKDQALEAMRSQVFGEIHQIKADLQALRTDLRKEWQSYKETKRQIADAIVTRHYKVNPTELAEAIKPLKSLNDYIKPLEVPVPIDLPLPPRLGPAFNRNDVELSLRDRVIKSAQKLDTKIIDPFED